MIRVESFFCILMAVAAGASKGNDNVPFSIRAGEAPDFQDTVGDPLPSDTVYAAVTVATYPLALSIVNVARSTATSVADCRAQAIQKGGDVFEYDEETDKCNVASLQFPVCSTQQGNLDVYILPKFLTTGTPDDGTTVEPLIKGVLLWKVLSKPEAEYGSFRVDSTTISDYIEAPEADATSVQTIFTEADGSMVEIDADVVVSPACYSNSSCGTSFIYPIKPGVKRIFKPFNESCGTTVFVNEGEEVYILSHQKFGCEPFPGDDFVGKKCRVNYRGPTIKPLRLRFFYFNFVGDDKCDGFYLSASAYYNKDQWKVTKPCETPVREIIADYPRGRLDFDGKAAPQRSKIGFILKLSYV